MDITSEQKEQLLSATLAYAQATRAHKDAHALHATVLKNLIAAEDDINRTKFQLDDAHNEFARMLAEVTKA